MSVDSYEVLISMYKEYVCDKHIYILKDNIYIAVDNKELYPLILSS